MKPLIKAQLEKCSYANIPNINSNECVFIIPKYTNPKYAIGKMYIVKLPLYLVNNIHSVIAANWNNGQSPKSEYLKIYVSKIVGKMLYVDSIAFDYENNKDLAGMWTGYLPSEEITQIAEL